MLNPNMPDGAEYIEYQTTCTKCNGTGMRAEYSGYWICGNCTDGQETVRVSVPKCQCMTHENIRDIVKQELRDRGDVG